MVADVRPPHFLPAYMGKTLIMHFALIRGWRQAIELRQASPHDIVVPCLVVVEADLIYAMAVVRQCEAAAQGFEGLSNGQ